MIIEGINARPVGAETLHLVPSLRSFAIVKSGSETNPMLIGVYASYLEAYEVFKRAGKPARPCWAHPEHQDGFCEVCWHSEECRSERHLAGLLS